MERSYQSLCEDKPTFHFSELPGTEWPYSRHTISILARDETGKEINLHIALTPPQLVAIVKHVFWEITVRSMWAAKVLERLLRKRWGVYTIPYWKVEGSSVLADDVKAYREECTQLDFEFINGQRVMRSR